MFLLLFFLILVWHRVEETGIRLVLGGLVGVASEVMGVVSEVVLRIPGLDPEP